MDDARNMRFVLHQQWLPQLNNKIKFILVCFLMVLSCSKSYAVEF